MPENLILLSDLRDPVSFLSGARIPVEGRSGGCFEHVGHALVSVPEGNVARVGWHWDEYLDWSGLTIDPADPDVARWCDQKIAEATGRDPDNARLKIYHGNAEDPWVGWRCGHHYGWTSANNLSRAPAGTWVWSKRPELDCPALASVPCDEAHLPAARAALVRALYGKGRST